MPWHTDPATQLTYAVTDVSDTSVTLHDQQVPSRFQIIAKHPDWPVDALIVVTVDPHRGPIASGITNNWLTPEARAITDVPTYRELGDMVAAKTDLTRLLTEMAAEAAGLHYQQRLRDRLLADGADFGDVEVQRQLDQLATDGEEVAASAFLTGITRPRRRRLVSPKHLAEVAAVYREAYDQGLPPTKTVAERFYASHSTASRWVGLARESGALGPATGTKPGEATT